MEEEDEWDLSTMKSRPNPYVRSQGLDQQSLAAYQQRWQAVAAIEAAERQSASLADRWQQMNALLRLAMSLEFSLIEKDTIPDEGQQRWQKLIAIHLSSQE
ncbi:MAG: hypothetical protein DWI57_10450 [Chloroflexi bacterium]|nr:MAG: hypothetical protein DWI57_10450 [Chloroflexota bacterium]